jgi:hypothetical protein
MIPSLDPARPRTLNGDPAVRKKRLRAAHQETLAGSKTLQTGAGGNAFTSMLNLARKFRRYDERLINQRSAHSLEIPGR